MIFAHFTKLNSRIFLSLLLLRVLRPRNLHISARSHHTTPRGGLEFCQLFALPRYTKLRNLLPERERPYCANSFICIKDMSTQNFIIPYFYNFHKKKYAARSDFNSAKLFEKIYVNKLWLYTRYVRIDIFMSVVLIFTLLRAWEIIRYTIVRCSEYLFCKIMIRKPILLEPKCWPKNPNCIV